MLTEEDFAPVAAPQEEEIRFGRPLSSLAEAAQRLGKNPVAWVCMACLLVIVLGAVFVPMLSSFDYQMQNVAFANKPFFSLDPKTGATHWFGTDWLGRDIFVRAWFGARISLLVAVAVTLIDSLIGVVYGSLSGYLGGAVDAIMMRVLEVISGIPYLVVVLLLLALFPRGLGTIILAYSIIGWTGTARLVRGQVLHLREQEFIVASRIMGAGLWRIIWKGILPNIANIMIVSITLDIPTVIFTEAFLSMLGLGLAPPMPSLGIMANDALSTLAQYPTQMAVPAIIICLIMLCCNLLGDCLQDALEPGERRGLRLGRAGKGRRSKRVLF